MARGRRREGGGAAMGERRGGHALHARCMSLPSPCCACCAVGRGWHRRRRREGGQVECVTLVMIDREFGRAGRTERLCSLQARASQPARLREPAGHL